MTKNTRPFSVNRFPILKIDDGIRLLSTSMLNALRSLVVSAATTMGCGLLRSCVATIPPMRIPATKNRFHTSFFQSYLKNEILPGIQEAQICLSEEEIPKCLFPINNNAGTVRPINVPATYHGHG